jgi:hypothetical protein
MEIFATRSNVLMFSGSMLDTHKLISFGKLMNIAAQISFRECSLVIQVARL